MWKLKHAKYNTTKAHIHQSEEMHCTHTHPHTHPFNGPFAGTTRVSRYQKGKPNLDFTEARDSEWQWHQLGHMPYAWAKIAVLTHRVLHGNAPRYLGPLTSTADVPGRRALRSAGTNRLVVPPVRRATVGSRAFSVAAAHTWNSLPEHIVSASTLQSFKRHLKTFLLQQSFRLAL